MGKNYSVEYKENLKADYEMLSELYKKVMKQAGNGPYNEEEECIISDYNDVVREYNEVFNGEPYYKAPPLNKIREKRELPACKRQPIYCDNCTYQVREIDLSAYTRIGGDSV